MTTELVKQDATPMSLLETALQSIFLLVSTWKD